MADMAEISLDGSVDVTPRPAPNGHIVKTAAGNDELLRVRHFPALAAAIVPFVREAIAETVAPLIARIAELEARPYLEDAGTWDRSKLYRPGQVVTHDGSWWICNEANSSVQPGTSNCWRLCVRRGKDGKDIRR